MAAAALLAGCAGIAPRQVETSAPAAELHLSGRLSVQVENAIDQGNRGGNAGFDLSGSPAHGVLELSTPLGSLIARARWDRAAGQTVLETPGHERQFDDLDALTREMLGESIPVEALFDWLQGRAWSGAPSVPLAEAGNAGFEQLGWRVDLRRYADGLIIATRQGNPVVTLRARVESKD
ncbi:MAG: outer membrane lipoprotein LolB [Paucibacter sp.]|nr:outer membrane lipoprotein LolB [Roseateles sp.]